MDIALKTSIILQSIFAGLDATYRTLGTRFHDRRQEVEIVGGVDEADVQRACLVAGAAVAFTNAGCAAGWGDGAVRRDDGRRKCYVGDVLN